MEGSLSTFIYIAVAILVTLGIASLAFVAISLVGDILGVISSQEATIKERFDEVTEIYDGRVLKGIDLLNTLREFRNIDMTYPVIVTFTEGLNFTDPISKEHLYSTDPSHGNGITNEDIDMVIKVINKSMVTNSKSSIVDKDSQKWPTPPTKFDYETESTWPNTFNYEDRYNVTVSLEDKCHIDGNVMQAIIIHFEKIVPPNVEPEVGG